MKVLDVCKSYFNGFQEVSDFRKNDSTTNALAVLKVLSYFTVVIPLGFAAIYGAASLYGRVNKKEVLSELDQRVNSQNLVQTRQSSSSQIIDPKTQDSSSQGIDPKITVNKFLESIARKASDAEVFVIVSTDNDQPQLIKYSNFNNPFFPVTLYGSDLSKESVSINVANIRSMEIVPKIGSVVQSEDKEKLADLGITFDEQGFIQIPSEKFVCEKSVGSNNYHIKISSKEGVEIANINAKMTSYHSYCIVHWS